MPKKTENTPSSYADIIPAQLRGGLSEEVLVQLGEAVKTTVDRLVAEKVQLAVESERAILDENHEKKLFKLAAKIEECKEVQMKQAYTVIKEAHEKQISELLDACKQRLENQKSTILSEAASFKSKLVNQLSKFMVGKIEQLVPQQELVESVRNVAAIKTLKRISELVGVTPAAINENVKKGLCEAKSIIDEQNALIESHGAKESELQNRIEELETRNKLFEMTETLPENERRHMRRIMADKDSRFIVENFNDALSFYRQATGRKAIEAKKQVMEKAAKRVPTASRKSLLESVKATKPSSEYVDPYSAKSIQSVLLSDAKRNSL